jgi:hypothetical protein
MNANYLFPVNSVIKLNIKTKYYKDSEGRDHFGIKNYRYTFDYGERIIYTITNLFKGNAELSKYISFITLSYNLETIKTIPVDIILYCVCNKV